MQKRSAQKTVTIEYPTHIDTQAIRRSTLPPSELRTRRIQAQAIRSGDIDKLNTRLLQVPVQKIEEEEQEKSEHDTFFNVTMIVMGAAVMFFLLLGVFALVNWVEYQWQHLQTGQHPVTHIDDYFGFQGEDRSQNIDTHLIAANQNGDIVVIVVYPDETKATIIELQAYKKFPLDAVPEMHEAVIDNKHVIEVQVNDSGWILSKQGNAFVCAH